MFMHVDVDLFHSCSPLSSLNPTLSSLKSQPYPLLSSLNSHLMAMPGVSNEKDLVGEEEHDTGSVPKVAAAIDLGGDKRYHKITLREGFNLWCNMYMSGMTYSSPEEEEYRFSVFKETLARSEDVPALSLTQTVNCHGLADQTLEELELTRSSMCNPDLCCCLSLSELQAWADEIQTKYGGVDPCDEYNRKTQEYILAGLV